jgi:hypothetical protein
MELFFAVFKYWHTKSTLPIRAKNEFPASCNGRDTTLAVDGFLL